MGTGGCPMAETGQQIAQMILQGIHASFWVIVFEWFEWFAEYFQISLLLLPLSESSSSTLKTQVEQ